MAGTIVANTINTDTAGAVFTTNNAFNGIAKAWVNFNGSPASPTIRASLNVSSVTKISTGFYTVNFTTAFADTNYCAVLGHNLATDGSGDSGISPQISSYNANPMTTTYIILGLLYSGGGYDCNTVTAAIFR